MSDLVTPQEVAKAALRIDWLDTESAARRVAEHAAKALTLANARIARLEEALRPLARAADYLAGWVPDDESHWPGECKMPLASDLRRARAALKGDA